MDRLANQIDRDDTGDIVKDMQNAPSATESPSKASSASNAGGGVDSDGSRGDGGTPVSDGGGDDSNDKDEVVVFNSTNFFTDGHVFKPESNDERIIYFSRKDPKTLLQELKWQVLNGSDIDTLSSTKFNSSKGSGQLSKLTNSTVTLNFLGETRQYYGLDMYIQINWEKEDGVAGYTKTELFTVTGDSNDADKLRDELESDQSKQGVLETTTLAFGPSSTSGSQPSSSSEKDESSGGSGGLSTGATAGIAVGAVIGGLLIIGALVWFFLRRRRNKQSSDEYVTQQTYAVDKETHGRATDSPNSPYSDENHMQPVALGSLDRDRGAAPTPPPGGVPRSSMGSHDRAGHSGVQTPQGMSSNVAHLVEDGMTVDEIRRLEEEERQLDDEIERAARR